MGVSHKELLQRWSMRFSAGTAAIVILLSWLNGVKMPDLVIRAGISFGVIYFLTFGALNLFDRMAPPKPQEGQPSSTVGRGKVIDFSVGEEELPKPEELQSPQMSDQKSPGQVDPDLLAGLPDSKRQAEILRRMGWE